MAEPLTAQAADTQGGKRNDEKAVAQTGGDVMVTRVAPEIFVESHGS
jgi:hypothetical protein